MADVNIQSVRKSYGVIEIIKGVSVEIPDGDFVVLVGPSGCGKSTLLRMVAGLEEISGGEILIDGQVINDVEPKNRDIAMVFQNYALYPHMTVEKNMGFSLWLNKTKKSEIRKRVEEVAGILDLSEYLDRYPKQLSGGQRQRVAMGRAIVRNPQVFLFDEPLSNLDAKLRVQMRAELKEIHAKLNTTTIYVTHDQIEAMTMADKIVLMRDGIIEQAGTPEELYDAPANTFVAGFIGSPAMNLLEGSVGSKKRLVALLDGPEIGHKIACAKDTNVIVGFRPEHIELAQDGKGFAARVISMEFTGSDTLLAAQVGSHTLLASLRQRQHLKPGDGITLRVAPEHVVLFDARTTERIG